MISAGTERLEFLVRSILYLNFRDGDGDGKFVCFIIKHDKRCSKFQINNFDHSFGLWYCLLVDLMEQINENDVEPVK